MDYAQPKEEGFLLKQFLNFFYMSASDAAGNAIELLDLLVECGVFVTKDSQRVEFDFLQHNKLPFLWCQVNQFIEKKKKEAQKLQAKNLFAGCERK